MFPGALAHDSAEGALQVPGLSASVFGTQYARVVSATHRTLFAIGRARKRASVSSASFACPDTIGIENVSFRLSGIVV